MQRCTSRLGMLDLNVEEMQRYASQQKMLDLESEGGTVTRYNANIGPRVTYMDAKITCQLALMRLMEYFNMELPSYVDRESLRKLVIYLGGDVRSRNNGSWRDMQQHANMSVKPECMLLRKGLPGTPENEMFSFDTDKYRLLLEKPAYAIAMEHLRSKVPDSLIITYVNSILGEGVHMEDDEDEDEDD